MGSITHEHLPLHKTIDGSLFVQERRKTATNYGSFVRLSMVPFVLKTSRIETLQD